MTLEYLDVSHNYLSRLEGLENMKGLKVLKLKYNKIATFQSLRLLTYNRYVKLYFEFVVLSLFSYLMLSSPITNTEC